MKSIQTIVVATVITLGLVACDQATTTDNSLPPTRTTPPTQNFSDRYEALSELPLEGGYPSESVSKSLSEELYFQRAVQTYLWALPAMNMYAMKKGLGDQFGYGYNVVTVFEKRLKPNTLITTPNSDVIYGLGWADLSKTGPLVLEVPPKLQGLMDDMWHRPLVGPQIDGDRHYLGDLGLPGPDKGEGGKYLLVLDGYAGALTPESTCPLPEPPASLRRTIPP